MGMKAAEEAAECEYEKKAAHEMDKMAQLERMWEWHDRDACHGLCMSVGQSSLIASMTNGPVFPEAQGSG